MPLRGIELGFPTGRDSATFRDKGTEVPSLSRDKGTTSKSCHGTGRDSLSKSGTGRGTITILLSKSGTQDVEPSQNFHFGS